jgi:hypothetical protein
VPQSRPSGGVSRARGLALRSEAYAVDPRAHSTGASPRLAAMTSHPPGPRTQSTVATGDEHSELAVDGDRRPRHPSPGPRFTVHRLAALECAPASAGSPERERGARRSQRKREARRSQWINLSNQNAADFLAWLGLPTRDLVGELPGRELAALCRRRLWPEPGNLCARDNLGGQARWPQRFACGSGLGC